MAEEPEGTEPEPTPEKPAETDWQAETEKWKSLARKNEAQAKANAEAARKLTEIEDSSKSELERSHTKAAEADKRAAAAEASALRIEVALDKAPEGMSVAMVRKLAKRLTGTTREELEADAEELFEDFATGDEKPPLSRRPKEKLRPGASGADDDAPPAEIAEQVWKQSRGGL